MKWDREAVTALVAAWVVTGEAETIMGSQCCSLSRGSTSSKLKQKAAAQSWSHTGSCGCTDSATFAPKICLVLVGADWERRSKSQDDEPLENA